MNDFIKRVLIIAAALIILFLLIGGNSGNQGSRYGEPEGIEDYNSPASNPYGG